MKNENQMAVSKWVIAEQIRQARVGKALAISTLSAYGFRDKDSIFFTKHHKSSSQPLPSSPPSALANH